MRKKPVGKEKTRKNAMGFAGGGAGRSDFGVRRVDDYLGTYENVERIEKPGKLPFGVPQGGEGRPRKKRNDLPSHQLSAIRRLQ